MRKNQLYIIAIITLVFYAFIAKSQSFTALNNTITGLPNYAKNGYWVDFDNDNKLDLFLDGKLYKNIGNDSFQYISSTIPFNLGITFLSFYFDDYNHDGYIDILTHDSIFLNYNGLFNLLTDTCYYLPTGTNFLYNGGDLLNKGKNGIYKYYYTYYFDIRFFESKYPDSCGFIDKGNIAFGEIYDFNNDGYKDILNFNNSIMTFNNGIDISPRFSNIVLNIGIYNKYGISDINNDGYLDISISGRTIFLNDSSGLFLANQATGILDSNVGYQLFIDLNSDGKLDVIQPYYNGLLAETYLFLNDSNLTYSQDTSFQTGGIVQLILPADYDNDGDIDLFICSEKATSPGYITALYRNDSTLPNTPPTSPATLWTTMDSTKVILHWNQATDVETPQATLSYNLMVGTTPKGIDITSPMADTATGFRRIVELGNAQLNNFYILDKSIFNIGDTVYWSVQTIDNGYGYSPFSQEGSAIIYARMEAPVFDTICGNDSILWRGNYYQSSGKYKDSYSLDSAFYLELEVQPSYLNEQVVNICSGSTYTWNGTTYYLPGTYDIPHYTTQGCDSLERLVLRVNPSNTTLLTNSICMGDSLLFGTKYINATGNYSDSLYTINSCDSIIQMALTVSPSDTNVLQSGDTLFAVQPNAIYRWWDCDKHQFVYAANQSYFAPYQNGHYAAEISSNGCVFLTQCYEVTGLSLDNESNQDIQINLMPNPNNGVFFLELKNPKKQEYKITIYDALGKEVYTHQTAVENYIKIKIDLSPNQAGVYQLRIVSVDDIITRRFILQ